MYSYTYDVKLHTTN